jgi:hypothetical protein
MFNRHLIRNWSHLCSLCNLWLIPTSGFRLKGTTLTRPGFAEERIIDFAYFGDNVRRTVVIDTASLALWNGEVITALRIAPGTTNGATFEIDHVRVRCSARPRSRPDRGARSSASDRGRRRAR